jgi:neutral ceramidase
MTIEAGAARVDITPLEPVPMAGYPPIRLFEGGPQDHRGYTGRVGPSEGVHDPIYARTLVIGQGDTLVILVALDVCVIPLAFTQRIRETVAARWNINPNGLFIAASHSHSGPDYAGQWEEVDASAGQFIEQMTVACIEQALACRRPAKIGWGEGNLSEPAINRRDATRPIDPRVTVLRVDDAHDVPIGVVYCYACHPIVVGTSNRLISGEYPGYASRTVETAMGGHTVALFLNGAAGNINPAAWPYSARKNISSLSKEIALAGQAVTFRSHREAQRLGTILGGEVLRVASLIETGDEEVVGIWGESIQVPLKAADELEVFIHHDCLQERYANLLRGAEAIPSEVIAVRLGSGLLLGLPGEPFVEIGLELQDQGSAANGTHIRVVGYVNDYPGYVIRREDYAENRYETVATPLSVEGAETIVEAARQVKAKALGG